MLSTDTEPNPGPTVQATVRYLQPGPGKPVYYASDAGVGEDHDIGIRFDERVVGIADARRAPIAPTLDREGFTLLRDSANNGDFYQLAQWREAYDATLGEQVRAHVGAERVWVFDHTLRSDSADLRRARSTREPANFVHNDYSNASAAQRVRDLLDPDTAAQVLAGRYAIINVWRSIRGAVQRSPIALCDAGSVADGDRVAVERRASNRIGELEMVTWNARHRWLYYPQLVPAELLLIKTFDSATDGRASRCVHSAFALPGTTDATPARESLESRLLLAFPGAGATGHDGKLR